MLTIFVIMPRMIIDLWVVFYMLLILFKEAVFILKIKKSHRQKDEWIVYNPDNFELHTHCRSFRVALVLRNNVQNHRIPRSTDIRLLVSHLRLTRNRQYRRLIEERIEQVSLKGTDTLMKAV